VARSQRNYVGLALRALLRLEWHPFRTGICSYEAEWGIIRQAVRAYLADPYYDLPDTATAIVRSEFSSAGSNDFRLRRTPDCRSRQQRTDDRPAHPKMTEGAREVAMVASIEDDPIGGAAETGLSRYSARA
jgi:hypothetical protein